MEERTTKKQSVGASQAAGKATEIPAPKVNCLGLCQDCEEIWWKIKKIEFEMDQLKETLWKLTSDRLR